MVHNTNIALNALVTSRQPLNTLVRNYVNCLTRTSEHLHASNAILQKENEDTHTALTTRKERLGAKWKIIKGKHCLSVAEVRDRIRVAEEAIKKSTAAKGTRGKKHKAKVIEESSDGYGSYSEQEMDQEFECLNVLR